MTTEEAAHEQRTAHEACANLDKLKALYEQRYAQAIRAYEAGDFEACEAQLMAEECCQW